MTYENLRIFRKNVVEAILATDMSNSFKMKDRFKQNIDKRDILLKDNPKADYKESLFPP